MPRLTPFHPRTSELAAKSFAWKEWSGYIAACNFDRHSEREYFAIRRTAGLLDVTPLYKYEVHGPDAGLFLATIWTRDITKVSVGQVVYSTMCDEHGWTLDDGTITRLGKTQYRVTSSESWLRWFLRHSRGFDVTIEESTDSIAALALQGPASRDILRDVVAMQIDRLRFFRSRPTTLAGHDVLISRTGYTGDLGFEIWMDNEVALPVWDALIEAGHRYGIEPIGLDALDVSRIEAGFVLQGIDYVSAHSCLIEGRKSTPSDAGLGWTVDLDDRPPFIGQAALLAERACGPKWDLVGLELDWAELADLYASYNLPPHLAPIACRDPLPVYTSSGRKQIGQVTSNTWSPTLKKMLALAQIRTPHTAIGTKVQVEHTVEFERRTVTATIVPKPFFDPDRKKSTPGKKA